LIISLIFIGGGSVLSSLKKFYTLEIVGIYISMLKSRVTEETSKVFCEKFNQLRNTPSFNINADSQLPPVNMEMFDGHPDPQAAFREAVLHADTVGYLITLIEALMSTPPK
jgi:hypothetical protein